MLEKNLVTRFKSKFQQVDWKPWLAAFAILAVLIILWRPVSEVGANRAFVRQWIEQMGPFAPVAFFLLNIIQIVVAPIPGYPVQVLGGILFGFIPGSIYTIGGMVAGGTLAAWLGRRLGRPWLESRIGAETLEDWSKIAHIDSFWMWWVILLIPIGDLPYFFAGLSHIRLSWFALAILCSRGPFTLLIVWTGHSVADLSLNWIVLLMAAIGVIVVIGLSQRERIEAWGRTYVSYRSAEKAKELDSP